MPRKFEPDARFRCHRGYHREASRTKTRASHARVARARHAVSDGRQTRARRVIVSPRGRRGRESDGSSVLRVYAPRHPQRHRPRRWHHRRGWAGNRPARRTEKHCRRILRTSCSKNELCVRSALKYARRRDDALDVGTQGNAFEILSIYDFLLPASEDARFSGWFFCITRVSDS